MRLPVPLLAMLSLLLLAGSSPGATWRSIGLEEQCRQSAWIVHALVLSERMVQENDGIIWTLYEVEILEGLKRPAGADGDTLNLRQPGGTVGERSLVIPGSVYLDVGEELVLFTRGYGMPWQQVAHGHQGRLSVSTPRPAERGSAGKSVPEARTVFDTPLPMDLIEFKAALRAVLVPDAH